MEKKYEMTGNSMNFRGHTLYQIRALRKFGQVQAGELGGFIASEKNLDQNGIAWVGKGAFVFGDAMVKNNAQVLG